MKETDIYPKLIEIEIPIEYIDYETMIDHSSESAVRLKIEINRSNYTKKDVKQAIKVACAKCLEVFD